MSIFNLEPPLGVINQTITGRVVDGRTKEPLKYVTVYLEDINGKTIAFSITNDSGMYEINFDINVDEVKRGENSLLLRYHPTKQKGDKRYKDEDYIPLTSDREIKTEIPPIELTTLLEDKIGEIKSEISKVPRDIWKKIKNGVKLEGNWVKKYFEDQTKNIFTGLIPTIAKLLINFGINDQKGKKTKCPPKDELINIIRKRNNLVKALNNIYKGLDIIVKANTVGLTLIKVFKMLQKIKINLPTPIIEYTPHSLIHIKQESIKKLQKEIDRYEGLSMTIMVYIVILKELISLLLSYLRVLDKSIEDCYLEQNFDPSNPLGFELNMDPLLNELININDNSSTDNNFKKYHNGFELKVINVDNSRVGGLYRRQAVGINPQGVISVRGEQSFSSSDEILINQLIFYINVNNLKAY